MFNSLERTNKFVLLTGLWSKRGPRYPIRHDVNIPVPLAVVMLQTSDCVVAS
jgi:hypothetical protein